MAESTRSDPPQDRRLDRRRFLERMGLMTAAAATGSAFTPAPMSAAAPVLRALRLPDPRTVRATEPYEMTVVELAALIHDRSLSPLDLLESYHRRIRAYDSVLKAFNTVPEDAARSRAGQLADEPWSGPLHGIPLAIKDNYFTQGVRTTANSHIFADFVPDFDGTAWARLKGAGAILLGKTQMGPLATSRATTPDGETTTVNAWAPDDPSVDPGGSSSGSATSVASRMAPCGTGTQTGGSITNPASRQGLTGLKPTMGRVSLYGVVPLTYTRDHPGPLARDAMDAAVMLQTMAGPDPLDPRTLGHPPVPDLVTAADPVRSGGSVGLRWPSRIGVPPGYLDIPEEGEGGGFGRRNETPEERERRQRQARERMQAEVAARRAMLAAFESLGARTVEVEMPEEWDLLTSGDFNNVRLPERTEPFLQYMKKDVRLFGVSLSPWINGLLLGGPEYLRGQRAKMLLLERVLDGIFDQCDVVLQTEPIPFDIIGLPLIAFPIGFEQSRGSPLPVAGMFGGMPYGEERLLSLVAAYQAVTEWHTRKPADPVVEGEGGPERDVHGPAVGGVDRREVLPRARPLRLDIHDVMADGE